MPRALAVRCTLMAYGAQMQTQRHDPMSQPHHILVVDDDAAIRGLLGEYLQGHGYRTTTVQDGVAMEAVLGTTPVDLIVLDLMLPGDDGLVLCRRIRAESAVPIIMLTARNESIDRVVGLEMGADDYVAKPFEPRELLARIKGVLRRLRGASDTVAAAEVQRYRFSGWTLDVRLHQLLSPRQVVVPLAASEHRLLTIFLERPKLVLTRDQLMDLCHGREAGPFDRSIDVRVSQLRQRLGDSARNPTLIRTVRSVGYLLAADVERE